MADETRTRIADGERVVVFAFGAERAVTVTGYRREVYNLDGGHLWMHAKAVEPTNPDARRVPVEVDRG